MLEKKMYFSIIFTIILPVKKSGKFMKKNFLFLITLSVFFVLHNFTGVLVYSDTKKEKKVEEKSEKKKKVIKSPKKENKKEKETNKNKKVKKKKESKIKKESKKKEKKQTKKQDKAQKSDFWQLLESIKEEDIAKVVKPERKSELYKAMELEGLIGERIKDIDIKRCIEGDKDICKNISIAIQKNQKEDAIKDLIERIIAICRKNTNNDNFWNLIGDAIYHLSIIKGHSFLSTLNEIHFPLLKASYDLVVDIEKTNLKKAPKEKEKTSVLYEIPQRDIDKTYNNEYKTYCNKIRLALKKARDRERLIALWNKSKFCKDKEDIQLNIIKKYAHLYHIPLDKAYNELSSNKEKLYSHTYRDRFYSRFSSCIGRKDYKLYRKLKIYFKTERVPLDSYCKTIFSYIKRAGFSDSRFYIIVRKYMGLNVKEAMTIYNSFSCICNK